MHNSERNVRSFIANQLKGFNRHQKGFENIGSSPVAYQVSFTTPRDRTLSEECFQFHAAMHTPGSMSFIFKTVHKILPS